MCKSTTYPHSILKIVSFNVEGLTSEMEDPNFLDMIYKHDLCLLNETWRGSGAKLNIPGLWDFSLIRPKTKRQGEIREE